MPGKGKIKAAIQKAKENKFRRQFERGEKKGTNVYMGRGLGMTTAKEAKKINKPLSKRKQNKMMKQFKEEYGIKPQKATGSAGSTGRMLELVNNLLVEKIDNNSLK